MYNFLDIHTNLIIIFFKRLIIWHISSLLKEDTKTLEEEEQSKKKKNSNNNILVLSVFPMNSVEVLNITTFLIISISFLKFSILCINFFYGSIIFIYKVKRMKYSQTLNVIIFIK